MTLFSKSEAYEIFASLTSDKARIGLVRKYIDLSRLGSMDERRELFARSTSAEKATTGAFISPVAWQNTPISAPTSKRSSRT